MIARLYRFALAFLLLGIALAGLLFAWRFATGGVEAVFPSGDVAGDPAFRLLFGVPAAVAFLCVLAAKAGEGIAFLYAAYQEGRAIFVHRILAPREAALGARIQRLERLLGTIDVRDGILHARGLVVSDAGGAPLLTLGVTDHGATLLTVTSGKGEASVTAVVHEHGCAIDLRDPEQRLRFRAATKGEQVWIALNDREEEPRAGFVLEGTQPNLLLVRSREADPEGETEEPGYH